MDSTTRKTLCAAVLAALVFSVPALAADDPAAGAEKPQAEQAPAVSPDDPVVIVNGQPILRGEYDRALKAYVRNLQRMAGGVQGGAIEPNAEMKSEVLSQLVDRELLYQESLKYPVEDRDKQVDEQLAEIAARFPSPEVFQKALSQDGLDELTLRDLIGRQVLVRHYVETEIAPDLTVSDEEVEQFYKENEDKFTEPEQVKASHILIRVDPNASVEDKKAAREKAEALRERAVGGEDFAELAKENSEDPGSAQRGGDLGFFTRERMVTPFADAAFALDEGKISEVVETQFGYHVIEVTDHKDAQKKELKDVKDQIAQYLTARALDQAVQEKVSELKKGAEIEVVASQI